jgi:NAD(P)-dependent dehydrogenase (short-subunit alcohol dehydrogenase family)
MQTQLSGKTAVVTGAGRGIGRGIATILAQRGATVVVCDLDAKLAQSVAGEINGAGSKALALEADVTSQASMNAASERAMRNLGRVDICVANAGVIGAPGFTQRPDYSEQDWDATFGVNVKGVAHTVDAFATAMKERRSGKIVIIASHGGRAPRGVGTGLGTVGIPYSVSKAAAIQYCHHLALALAPFSINVNCVCPGSLWTPMWEKIAVNRVAIDPGVKGKTPRDVFDDSIRQRTPLGRPQTPEDIGKAVAFLVSDDASEITGQALNVNGGAVLN